MAKSIEDMQKLLVKKEAELNKFISGKEEYISRCATELFNYMLDKLNDQVYMNSFSDAGKLEFKQNVNIKYARECKVDVITESLGVKPVFINSALVSA